MIPLFVVFTAVLLCKFQKYYHQSQLISGRFVVFVYLQIFGAGFQLLWVVPSLLGRERFPCALHIMLPLSIMVLQAVPYVIRLLLFHNNILLNQLLASYEYSKAMNEAKEDSFYGELGASSDMGSSTGIVSKQSIFVIQVFELNETKKQTLARLRRFSGTKFGMLIYCIGLLLWIVLSLRQFSSLFGCFGCSAENFPLIELYLLAVGILAFTFILLFRIKNEPDPMRIKEDLMFVAFSAMACISGWLLAQFDPNDLELNGEFTWMYIWVLCGFLMTYGMLRFPINRLGLSKRKKSMARKLGAIDSVTLDEVLKTTTGKKLFKTHLMNELCIENFYFYQEVGAWKKAFEQSRCPELVLKETKAIIIEKYIGTNAPYRVNISFAMAQEIVNHADRLVVADFDAALNEVAYILNSDVFPRFKKTKTFLQHYDV